MGTVFSFDVRGYADEVRARDALAAAVASLHQADRLFSTYREDSQVSRLSRGNPAHDDHHPDLAEVMALCEEAERITGGWFSPRYAGPAWDPTGLVKGWAVERAARTLAADGGASSVCVNGGGDVQLLGGPWRTGVSDPLNPGALVAIVESLGAGDLAVATSGPAERGCHILDPHTAEPPATALASVTVITSALTTADVCATAAYAMGATRARAWLEALPDTEALLITPDGTTWRTRGFPHPR
ncbi:FAD:protein FMN transferase [Streptomyces sp. TRM49041]|uniref:FAD:protein FMN transferase n=1 Tax=Streptomyces sp. TRM49041 TaxID=2603216 RepID=UPI0011EEB6DB|nr:FAD:protein FMN transferase [Streptomyces sp. TRM49041]